MAFNNPWASLLFRDEHAELSGAIEEALDRGRAQAGSVTHLFLPSTSGPRLLEHRVQRIGWRPLIAEGKDLYPTLGK
jgi:hypothetical protein